MTGPAHRVADEPVRRRALELSASFLVQAPAGSGKTELLIQRYLALLAVVDQPEEILAVTFTRKAAAEMRARVFAALDNASAGAVPAEPHLKTGYELARKVLGRDRQQGWGLLEQPGRLRISTLDAVNSALSSQTPLSAGFTSVNRITDDSEPLYREAARRTISWIDGDDSVAEAVVELLLHCDNRAERLEAMLAQMLWRRDQWLRQIGTGLPEGAPGFRVQLERNLAWLIDSILAEIAAKIPVSFQAPIIEMLNYAAQQMRVTDAQSSIAAWAGQTEFPAASAEQLDLWRGITAVFLTQAGSWRKTVNKNQGFPPGNKVMKDQVLSLIAELTAVPALDEALSEIADLPDPEYPDAQWRVLEAMLKTLPVLVAELKQVFAQRNETDFTEIAQEALAALGEDDQPTELGLVLDYRIRHLLLDEFQDTSRSQFELLQRLTGGWERDDGRTLFLVGDPMQSIYRFREAEVGLYLQAREDGIGTVDLEFLRLETNFRSDSTIVDWVNDVFGKLLPAREDRISGAVSFAPGTPFKGTDQSARVRWHTVPMGQDELQAQDIVAVIEQCREDWPLETVGILVRSRRHADIITRALRVAGIEFVGPDMETLQEQSVVQDLLALTRALTHVGDRLAWLAVLRAPWCGLSLNDLQRLAGHDHKRCVWELLNDESQCSALSSDGQHRVARMSKAMSDSMGRRGSLRDRVELSWLRLGGPATVEEQSDLELVDRYLDILDTVEAGEDCPDGAELRECLRNRPITRGGSDARVQVMTIHKAKGLEFDTVILPGLGYGTRSDDKPLLLWHEIADAGEHSPLVFAPSRPVGVDKDLIYELLWRFSRRQANFELDRLLYVATTRTKKRLHLFAQLAKDEEGSLVNPIKGSLLARLWPVVEDSLVRQVATENPEIPVAAGKKEKSYQWREVRLRRLPLNWALPEPPLSIRACREDNAAREYQAIEYEWASRWAMHVGTVAHRWLQEIGEKGLDKFDQHEIKAARGRFERSLLRLGTGRADLVRATDRVTEALINTVTDDSGRWILSADHAEASCELPVTVSEPGGFATVVIDRTFVCENGYRWIIDYKTSSHTGGKLDDFLHSEAERHAPQLRQYRDAIADQEERPIKTALYYPLLKVFQEVDVDEYSDGASN